MKKFHPDMNSGNKKYEEKLKLITLAYTQLKNMEYETLEVEVDNLLEKQHQELLQVL